MWQEYIDPNFREKAPKMINTESGGEIFWVGNECTIGSGESNLGLAGLMGAQDLDLDLKLFSPNLNTPKYVDATPGGFDSRIRGGGHTFRSLCH